ncbi:hypothetical protein FB566_3532 [Stackebrandtia endophytica]|uniref:Uncharacterized protein n=1 Tax=Stackebrandtia endophytica TaxID=1496996 RepID=A0A543AZD8_9ACTN|nr:hypothetical protein [Stackebrandtia endophytica]TQL77957.1 hypothetical protein FB566_3532 [Stackebrandtia endophytica]
MSEPMTVAMPKIWNWLFPIGLGAVGVGLGFAVRPVFNWMIDLFDSAPGPLRITAALPTVWAVLGLTVIGILVGLWLAGEAQKEAPVVTVDSDHVEITLNGHTRYFSRERVAAVYRDGADLVMLDDLTRELARDKVSDLSATRLQEAFEGFGYPWLVEDRYRAKFRRWTDGHPDLSEPVHRLLRERSRAITAKKPGEVATLTEQLRDNGIVVRDRDDAQEYRDIDGH